VTVTAAQLAHLAELAAFASNYFANDPGLARIFGHTALLADSLSADLQREESDARIGALMSPRERVGGPLLESY
jgi:hypothetical protein